jgi:hypothetical protein
MKKLNFVCKIIFLSFLGFAFIVFELFLLNLIEQAFIFLEYGIGMIILVWLSFVTVYITMVHAFLVKFVEIMEWKHNG